MSRRSRHVWSIAASAIAGGMFATYVLVSPMADADPSAVAKAQAALDSIQEQASAVEASYAQSQAKLEEANKTLQEAEADLKVAQQKVETSKQSLALVAQASFQDSSIGITARLLSSPDDTTFLSQLAILQSVSARNNDQLQAYQLSQAKLTQLEATAKQARDEIAAETAKQKSLSADYQAKEQQATDTLNSLSADEQERLADLQAQAEAAQAAQLAAQAQRDVVSRSDDSRDDSTSESSSASSRASIAVSYALSQVGKSYVLGGTGPTVFDCSGLMLRAWEAAGVSLPRTSQEQFNVGRAVSVDQLQPGDLVFYYSGITHVGMYIGDGRIVDAANPRQGIKIDSLYSMPYMGARRVG